MPYSRKEAKQRWWKKNTQQKRQHLIKTYGGKCVRCGFSDIRALQIDHVGGGGVEELRKITNRRTYYRNVLEQFGTGKYQLLCANCNWIKRSEKHEHT